MVREIANLKCPKCGGITAVKDSRPTMQADAIRRRRMCLSCGSRITTYEVPLIEGISAQGVINLLAGTRAALDALEKGFEDARIKLVAAKQNLSAVEHVNNIVSGNSNAKPPASY